MVATESIHVDSAPLRRGPKSKHHERSAEWSLDFTIFRNIIPLAGGRCVLVFFRFGIVDRIFRWRFMAAGLVNPLCPRSWPGEHPGTWFLLILLSGFADLVANKERYCQKCVLCSGYASSLDYLKLRCRFASFLPDLESHKIHHRCSCPLLSHCSLQGYLERSHCS